LRLRLLLLAIVRLLEIRVVAGLLLCLLLLMMLEVVGVLVGVLLCCCRRQGVGRVSVLQATTGVSRKGYVHVQPLL